MIVISLPEEQLNFLVRLNIQGPLHYSYFGDRVGDDKAKQQLRAMAEQGYVIFDGMDVKITEKVKKLVVGKSFFHE
ncbi:MAG: hypothetical protein FH756_05995 [Firmicutes bacterium]|nr:hypothetical protein [Bacillota bacterium]